MTKEEINKELNENGVDGLVDAIQKENVSINFRWFIFWLFTCVIFGGAILTNATPSSKNYVEPKTIKP